VRALAIAVAIAACAPQVDTPAERQRAIDRADADRLAAELAALPGAVRATAELHRPVVDPFTLRASRPSAAIVIVVDDRADRRAVSAAAWRLVRGAAPEIPEPAIAIELGAVRPELARVGPFTVDAGSRRPLAATLAAALALIAALAGFIAWRERAQIRRGSSAQ